MTETKAQRKKRIARYKSREAAEARARRERAAGRKATVRRDSRTGEWIVEIFFLAVALSLFGALFRRD